MSLAVGQSEIAYLLVFCYECFPLILLEQQSFFACAGSCRVGSFHMQCMPGQSDKYNQCILVRAVPFK
jgi:hypothetical protein